MAADWLCALILPTPSKNCETLGKSLSFSETQFPIVWNGDNKLQIKYVVKRLPCQTCCACATHETFIAFSPGHALGASLCPSRQ